MKKNTVWKEVTEIVVASGECTWLVQVAYFANLIWYQSWYAAEYVT